MVSAQATTEPAPEPPQLDLAELTPPEPEAAPPEPPDPVTAPFSASSREEQLRLADVGVSDEGHARGQPPGVALRLEYGAEGLADRRQVWRYPILAVENDKRADRQCRVARRLQRGWQIKIAVTLALPGHIFVEE